MAGNSGRGMRPWRMAPVLGWAEAPVGVLGWGAEAARDAPESRPSRYPGSECNRGGCPGPGWDGSAALPASRRGCAWQLSG
jgi:hypothetical protein